MGESEAHGWIDVRSELPEYGRRVYVFKGGNRSHRDVHEAIRTHTDNKGEQWSCDYQHYITHWMPLPSPPEEAQMMTPPNAVKEVFS